MKMIFMILLSMAFNSVFAEVNEVHKLLINKAFDKNCNDEGRRYAIDWLSKIIEDEYAIDEKLEKTSVGRPLVKPG